MGEFSPWHLLIVAAVFVLLFGAKRLPDAARSLGRSVRILQSELHADDSGSVPTEPLAPGAPLPTPPAGSPQP